MPNFPGGWELVLILVVVLVVFGSKRLPDSARSLGRSLRIFKAETKGLRNDDEAAPVIAPGPETAKFDPYTGEALQPPAASAPPTDTAK